MASHNHLDDDDDFGGDFAVNNSSKLSGNKRGFADLDDDEDDIFGSKKGKLKDDEAAAAPGVATGMILSLRESLQNCKDALATCQNVYSFVKKVPGVKERVFGSGGKGLASLVSRIWPRDRNDDWFR